MNMFRIKKYDKGFVVEHLIKRCWRKNYWTHFISVTGISSEPWYHKSHDSAETNMLNKIMWDARKESYDTNKD